jgi:hypothetical protein
MMQIPHPKPARPVRDDVFTSSSELSKTFVALCRNTEYVKYRDINVVGTARQTFGRGRLDYLGRVIPECRPPRGSGEDFFVCATRGLRLWQLQWRRFAAPNRAIPARHRWTLTSRCSTPIDWGSGTCHPTAPRQFRGGWRFGLR